MNILVIYLLIGCIVSFVTYDELEKQNITGDQILSNENYSVRKWFQEHPNCFKLTVILTFVVIIFIWPYVLYKMIQEKQ